MENLNNNKNIFEPCLVEVVHFGEDIILTSGDTSVNSGNGTTTGGTTGGTTGDGN